MRSHHELQKLAKLLRTCGTCDFSMTSDFPSREEHMMPQFVVFWIAIARLGLSSLKMPVEFLFSAIHVCKALMVSGWGIG